MDFPRCSRQLGPRDNQVKRHPNLVSYEELSESIKQLDGDAVLQVLTLIKELNWVIAVDVEGANFQR
jgi:hypothetical protein